MITKVFHQRSGSTMQLFNPFNIHSTGKSNRFSSQNVSRRHPLSPHPPPPPTSAPLQSSPTCCGNDMSLSCQRLPCSQRSPEAPGSGSAGAIAVPSGVHMVPFLGATHAQSARLRASWWRPSTWTCLPRAFTCLTPPPSRPNLNGTSSETPSRPPSY